MTVWELTDIFTSRAGMIFSFSSGKVNTYLITGQAVRR
jgi:hypothetical protein